MMLPAAPEEEEDEEEEEQRPAAPAHQAAQRERVACCTRATGVASVSMRRTSSPAKPSR